MWGPPEKATYDTLVHIQYTLPHSSFSRAEQQQLSCPIANRHLPFGISHSLPPESFVDESLQK